MFIGNIFKIIPEPFGLDISDSSVKAAKLYKKSDSLFLTNFGDFDIERGVIEDGLIVNEDKLAAIIREGLNNLNKGPMNAKYVACSLPEQKTYLRMVQIPKTNADSVREALSWEIEANIPITLEEAYFDWEIIPPLEASKHLDHLDVLVSVAPKDLIDSYTRTLSKAGLTPFLFESESVALARSLIKKGFSREPTLIVDLGQTRTSFIIYVGYALRFTSSIKISGDDVTGIIMRSLSVDRSEAERLKIETGLDKDKDPRVFEVVISILTDLKEQIEKYKGFYMEHASHIHDDKPLAISRVIISGGGALLRGVEKYFSLTLNMQVDLANPWVNIFGEKIKSIPELSYEESIRYATVLGLALSRKL